MKIKIILLQASKTKTVLVTNRIVVETASIGTTATIKILIPRTDVGRGYRFV